MNRVLLGQKVKDSLTGFTGTVTAIADHLIGCRRLWVQPGVDKDGKHMDGQWIDEPLLQVIDAEVLSIPGNPSKVTGGFHSTIK